MRRILVAENLVGALVGTVVLAVRPGRGAWHERISCAYTRLSPAAVDRSSYYGYFLCTTSPTCHDVLILAVGW
jgi:hypothetical protein